MYSKESIDRFTKGGEFTPEDMQLLASQVGDMDGTNFEEFGDYWPDSQIDAYAKYINDMMGTESADRVEQLEKRVNMLEQIIMSLVGGE